jgi:hypothetical protein
MAPGCVPGEDEDADGGVHGGDTPPDAGADTSGGTGAVETPSDAGAVDTPSDAGADTSGGTGAADTDLQSDAGLGGVLDNVNLNDFEEISLYFRDATPGAPHLYDMNTAAVTPHVTPTYWALVYSLEDNTGAMPSPVSVAVEHGTRCGTAADQAACLSQLDAVVEGLYLSEPTVTCRQIPNFIDYAIVQNTGDVIEATDDAKAFLGTIDSEEEAILLALLSCYYPRLGPFPGDAEAGGVKDAGIRAVPGGYELLVRFTTAWCEPSQEDRVWLSITTDGVITELGRDVARYLDSECG